jgi:hypothetical protein
MRWSEGPPHILSKIRKLHVSLCIVDVPVGRPVVVPLLRSSFGLAVH